MNLSQVREVKVPLKQSTLALFIKEGEILLAMKKRGFGVGKWNGIGGKIQEGELPETAMAREVEEEVGAVPLEFDHFGNLYFYDPHDEENNWQVHVYVVHDWYGDIVESEEMKPAWVAHANIPYSDMWPDDKHWLPRVLGGERINGHFLFNPEKEIVEFEIIPLV